MTIDYILSQLMKNARSYDKSFIASISFRTNTSYGVRIKIVESSCIYCEDHELALRCGHGGSKEYRCGANSMSKCGS